jgi:hypothetical protein
VTKQSGAALNKIMTDRPFRFPWYDSNWLTSYLRARQHIAMHTPDRLDEFVAAFEPLRVDPGFQMQQVTNLFDDSMRERLRQAVAAMQTEQMERHELFRFGRLLQHDHPVLDELEQQLAPRVSEWVGEEVEACYNFLCLYNNLGTCEPHMDSPVAKWTVDYCIEQSEPWPLYFSQVVPWPEDWFEQPQHTEDWGERIRRDPANRFTAYTMQENDALVFAGSSQWHYRNRIARTRRQNFCHLAFFHYIPKGMRALVLPQHWGQLFGIPELQQVVIREMQDSDPKKAVTSSL